MGSPVLGELLILFLLILNCSRMFFLKYGKVDSLTILAPVCVVLSVLQIVSWNADFFSVVLLVISIFAFFTNFRALLRFCSGLYVDHYSIAFKIGAFIVLLLTVAETAALIYFFPVHIIPKNHKVQLETVRLRGNFSGGFEKNQGILPANGIIYKYSPDTNFPEMKSIEKPEKILLLSDKRADSRAYIPYLIYLAEKGYTVYTGDFYSKEVRWLGSSGDVRFLRRILILFDYWRNPVQFTAQKEFYAWNTAKELSAMLSFVREESEEPVFIICDWMANIAVEDFMKEKPEGILGALKLSELEEFEHPGFGFIRLTYPLEYFTLFENKIDRNLDNLVEVTEKTVALLPYHEPKVIASESEDNSETAENTENPEELENPESREAEK